MGLSGQMKKKEEDKCIIYQHVFNITTSFKIKRELGFPKCKDRRLVQEEMLRKKNKHFQLAYERILAGQIFSTCIVFFYYY